jgi:ketosteroid isomerase-like protein
MPNTKQIADQFIAVFEANQSERYEAVLHEDASLRVWRWDGGEAHRPRARVIQCLMDERSAWPDATLEVFHTLADEEHVAMEFRIQATEQGRYVEHNRSVWLTIRNGRVQTIDLYCAEPLPSARRKGWIAPATLTDDELNQLFATFPYSFDVHEWVWPNMSGRTSLRGGVFGSGNPHPGSNGVGWVRWTAEEADAKIQAMIESHRQRNIGFQWFVGPYDTPADLRARLEQHGFMLAGDMAVMARAGLGDCSDIRINPHVTVEVLDGSDIEAIEAALQISARGFNLTSSQVDEQRAGFYERVRDPKFQAEELNYLARLDGAPVAHASLLLRMGIAYLNGASTLAAHRNQQVYATLLRRRLEDAYVRGYRIAAIDAAPMSRRVVSRYGFKEYAKIYIYGWMPEMNAQVIRALVPQD